ncbi:MAG: nucleotidyltransferase domain-containing protein [Candidatus Wallbacteria bacterium]|nr:nucleotidyltransferase domain-containing protein [Candidatus Wallbacteria bacterium]
MDNIAIVRELKELLHGRFKDIRKVVFYGSRATGHDGMDSDFDVLIVVGRLVDWKLENEIIDACYEIDLRHDVQIDPKIIAESDLSTVLGRQPFVVNALENGVTV